MYQYIATVGSQSILLLGTKNIGLLISLIPTNSYVFTYFIFQIALEQLLTSDLNKTVYVCMAKWETVCLISSWC